MPITDYYVTTDAMGSVMAVLDESGNVLERRSYDAFGEATYMLADGTVVPDSPTGVDIGFQGQLMDELTGMYQMGYRWYSPVLGRWVSRDPISLDGGANPMAFVGNAPNALRDTTGLTWDTNLSFLESWILGNGDQVRFYTWADIETRELSQSPGGRALEKAFYDQDCKGVRGFTYGTFQAFWDTFTDLSDTGFQVGGFAGATAINNHDCTVTYTIYNEAGTHSFFYHIVPNVPDSIYIPFRGAISTPGRTIKQTFQWTSRIRPCSCGC